MSGATNRLGLFKAGGGSQNKYGPADVVDIDKINDSLDLIDDAVGVQQYSTANRPKNPYLWQVIKDTDLDYLITFNGSAWVAFLPARLSAGQMLQTYWTQDELANGGKLDSRYFTEDELLVQGKIDGRYVTRNSTGLIKPSMLPFKVLYGSYSASTTSDAVRGYSDKNTFINFSSADNYAGAGAFSQIPKVFLSVDTQATAEQHFGVTQTSKTNFQPFYWRSDTVDPTVNWVAIGV